MNVITIFLWLFVEISLVQNDFIWAPGKCRTPRTQYNWNEYGLVGIRIAWAQTNAYAGKCIYINITKTAIKNTFIFEKVTRIFNTSQTEWKMKEKGLLKVRNGTWYFYGRLELPFRSMSFHAVAQTSNCLCVYACEQFLLLHRWDVTSYHTSGWCGFWWGTRCLRRLRGIGIDMTEHMTKTTKASCPRITEDDDRPAAEPDDCKAGTKCGNTIIAGGEYIANKVHGVYKKILQKIFGNETEVVTTAATSTPSTSTEAAGGTTTIPPFYEPGEPPSNQGEEVVMEDFR